ncbi:hypothetical protein D3C75_776390 [compost metagenome]
MDRILVFHIPVDIGVHTAAGISAGIGFTVDFRIFVFRTQRTVFPGSSEIPAGQARENLSVSQRFRKNRGQTHMDVQPTVIAFGKVRKVLVNIPGFIFYIVGFVQQLFAGIVIPSGKTACISTAFCVYFRRRISVCHFTVSDSADEAPRIGVILNGCNTFGNIGVLDSASRMLTHKTADNGVAAACGYFGGSIGLLHQTCAVSADQASEENRLAG